ncbi:MAG: hypothetical protein NC310_00480 [Roseburia sp.]|nr:hypothetical protein [Anaeroplasma bactoclasticum]MCM1195528.1 hypothetical protein [Roseburia sp.]MCM1556903.1 hypothetical protein [Anaeroplasma bactoclasticum]
MPIDYLTQEEQKSYDTLIGLINKYIYGEQFKKEVISELDNLISILTNAD